MAKAYRFTMCMMLGFFTIVAANQVHAAKRRPLSEEDRYIAGGIVGTLVGFGTGHAIENVYPERGWLFTITEAASVALIIVGAVVPMPQAASVPLIVVGALGLSAFKIWEIVDIWTGPMPTDKAFLHRVTPENRFARNFFSDDHLPELRPQLGLTLHF